MKFLNEKFYKKKLIRYFAIGSFTFFLVKGLVWLIIFSLAGYGLINFN